MKQPYTIRVLMSVIAAGGLVIASQGVLADDRFTLNADGSSEGAAFGSGSVTVQHHLLEAERQELHGRLTQFETTFHEEVEGLRSELEMTRVALAGEIEAVAVKTNAAQAAAENAQASADEALAQADELYQQLDDLEQEVVSTQLAVKRAQQAADAAQGTADSALAEARAAQAAAVAADALARLGRLEAKAAQTTANAALSEARQAQSSANAADLLARKGISDALAAYRHAEQAQQLANGAQSRADVAYALADKAYSVGVPSGAYAYFHQTTCPTGWVHANGANNSADLRGEFIRIWDAGRGHDAGRAVRSYQASTIRFPARIYHMDHGFSPVGGLPFVDGGAAMTPTSFFVSRNAFSYVNGDVSSPYYGEIVRSTHVESSETRPGNVALLTCKKR